MKSFKIIVITTLFLISVNYVIFAQDKIGPADFLASIQPRQMSLGGCSVNLVDANSFYFNPGTMGVYYLDHTFSISIPFGIERSIPAYAEWSEWSKLNGWDISAGINTGTFLKRDPDRPNVAIAFGYMNIRDNSTSIQVYPYVDPDFKETYNISSKYYAVSFAYEYYIRIGIGYALESPGYYSKNHYYEEEWNGDDTNDLGIYTDLPIKLATFKRNEDNGQSRPQLWLTPSIGYAKRNMNTYTSLSRNEEKYFGIGTRFDYREKNINLVSLLFIFEYDKPASYEVYNWTYDGGYSYTYEYDWRHKFGLELTLFDALFLRAGKVQGLDDATYGFGLSTRGMLTNFFQVESRCSKSGLRYILNKFDIRYEIGRTTIMYPYDWKTYHRICLTI